MIREAVERLCEGEWFDSEPLCRLPYFVTAKFSNHAINREDERNISEEMVIDCIRTRVKDIISDYEKHVFGPDDLIKIIDRDSCLVVVCGINPSYNKKRISQIVVVTCFIWDGRVNIDKGNNYFINEPSVDFIEAKEWNEENQDKVMSYLEWKRHGDSKAIRQQRDKAEKEYYWRNHPQEASRDKKMQRMERAYQAKEKKEKEEIHDSLPDGDLDAIRDYFKHFDKRQLSSLDSANKELWADDYRKKMKKEDSVALHEFVRKAAKQAVRESFAGKMRNSTIIRKAR